MNLSKQRELIENFPILYGLCNDNNNEIYHCMTLFGFECGDGWFNLIYNLSEKIETYNKSLSPDVEPIRATQVKEKYGTLRFYTNYGTDEIFDLIDEAETQSAKICESCGAPGLLREKNGWFYTSCLDCDNR